MSEDVTEVSEEQLPVTKVLYEEFDVELFNGDNGSSGKLCVLERVEPAFIEWTPYEAYDYSAHMSFDEWGVIAHDKEARSRLESSDCTMPLQIRISLIDRIDQEIGSGGRPCIVITTDSTKLPVLYFPKLDSVYRFIQCLKRYLCFMRHQNTLIVDHSKAGLRNVMRELDLGGAAPSDKLAKKIVYDIQDVYDVTLSGLSKVTNFLRGSMSTRPPIRNETAQRQQQAERETTSAPEHLTHRPAESDFELYDLRKPLVRTEPVERDWCFTRALWETHFDEEGRVCREKELQDRIFSGGIDPELRKEVWPFLLNVYPWNSTLEERAAIMQRKRSEYQILETQWKSVSPEQLKRFSLYRDREALVEKDVLRTDRALPFYEGEDNPNVRELYDMLMTYSQYNFDLGYVQGMSDLLSVLHMLFKDKLMAFWTFVGYMDMVESHFTLDQQKIQGKLSELSSLIYYCDSELFNHLEKEDSSNFFFCFRWLLINFKREFKNADIMELWEVLWTCPYNTDYALFIATAILLQERTPIIEQKMSFCEILRYINSLSNRLDLNTVLGNAEALFHNVRSQGDIPFNIRTNILHLTESPMSSLGATPVRSPPERPAPAVIEPTSAAAEPPLPPRDPASIMAENVKYSS